MSVARHDDLPERADEDSLRRLDKFAVDLRGYPYDKDEIAKIVAQTIGSKTSFHPYLTHTGDALLCPAYN